MKDHNAIRDRFSKEFALSLSESLNDNLNKTIQPDGYIHILNMRMGLLEHISNQLWVHRRNWINDTLPPG